MSCKSAIFCSNTSIPTLAVDSTIPLGSIVRRFGKAVNLDGDGILLEGPGYFHVQVSATVSPAAAGTVSVQLYQNGVAVPGAFASEYASAENQPVNVSFPAIIRNFGCCSNSSMSLKISAAAVLDNLSVTVEKI